MKKALLLFAMFAFIGTAYTATASVTEIAGVYCSNCKGDHKCDDNCKKNCKKAKSCEKGTKSSAKKKGCCSRGSAAAKSCHGKSGSKASASSKKSKEDKK